jgi:hypothetical protein
MKTRSLFTVMCVLVSIAGFANAGAIAQPSVRGAELTSRAATIVGNVVDGDDKPIAAAQLRLRNIVNGRSVAVTRGDQMGQFRFSGVASGSYFVELVDERGRVRGVSATFTVGPAETYSTIVRLTAHRAWYSDLFSNAALAVVSSAAALGITAMGNGAQPASGRF